MGQCELWPPGSWTETGAPSPRGMGKGVFSSTVRVPASVRGTGVSLLTGSSNFAAQFLDGYETILRLVNVSSSQPYDAALPCGLINGQCQDVALTKGVYVGAGTV